MTDYFDIIKDFIKKSISDNKSSDKKELISLYTLTHSQSNLTLSTLTCSL